MPSFSYRKILMLIIDALLVNVAVYGAFLLRLDGHMSAPYLTIFIRYMPMVTAVNLGFFIVFRLYGRVWEYASLGELYSIVKATTCALIAVILIITFFYALPHPPRSIYILGWVNINLIIGISRLWWRFFRDYHFKPREPGRRVLIIGAGDAGAMLVREIQHNPHLGLLAVGFIDDDPEKKDRVMLGLTIHGGRSEITRLVDRLAVDEIIIAMPSVSKTEVREIIDTCRQTPASLRILPDIYQSSNGAMITKVRQVQVEDLLGREPVETDLMQISRYIAGKTILITGGGGSIGSELCRQLARFSPRRLVILDNCENNLFDIDRELNDSGYGEITTAVLVDIKHRRNMEAVFKNYRPQVVFHAAAYKHVPMMERYPWEALRNNVLGTQNTAQMADKYGSEAFILISTDKAVNPTSIMGATKRLAELVIKDINRVSKTRLAAVRFGNVLGSRGSVIPTFKKQIERGGPVTVTHPEMKRYFMTIPEAVELVIQAGAIAQGGEVFVLDMGEPVKIADMAKSLIKLYGYRPGRDIEIIYTGVRPGEKLFEELFSNREEIAATLHERIFISPQELDESYAGINKDIRKLIENVASDREAIIKLIARLIPEYITPAVSRPPAEILVYMPEVLEGQKMSG